MKCNRNDVVFGDQPSQPVHDVPAIFSRRANSLARAIVLALLIAAVIVPTAGMLWVRTPIARGEGRAIKQPIAFDHRVHATALRVDCKFCHSGTDRSAHAGLPSTRLCVGCHTDVWLQSAAFAPVRASIANSTPIAWKRVNRLPDFVFFNHAVHINNGVNCAHCHGDVSGMAQVSQTAPLTMSWCVDCHRNSAQSGKRVLTNCSTCHR